MRHRLLPPPDYRIADEGGISAARQQEISLPPIADADATEAEVSGSFITDSIYPEDELPGRNLYIKTNAPAWLMLWTNIAFEIDLAPHWSAQLPIYYSGFNYFRRDVKFRTFSFLPEVRWWSRADNTGFFANLHLGCGWYNYAKGGEFRYQDHDRNTPALGGGVGIGYRFYFCRDRRWTMEAAVGCGVYRLDYDIFRNIDNGLIMGREKRTFFGIDQAALSFSYSFGIEKKGGGK